jgi:glycerate 2-kinase
VLGVGGSATVDGGAGILQALGARLLDADGSELPRGGGALSRLARIDLSRLEARVLEVKLEIACDVDSPLLGEHGAARLFGPQKGATASEVEQLESALAHFARIVARDFGRNPAAIAGGGAAGGIAGGLHGVLGARLLSGVELVLDALGIDQALAGASLCITAEGRLDRQSLRSKGPLGVARRARARSVPVVALAGAIAPDVHDRDFPAFDGLFSICAGPITLEQAMREAAPLLASAAERVVRLFSRGSDKRETRAT